MVNLGYRHNRRFVATGADTYARSAITATRNRYSRWGPPCAVRPARDRRDVLGGCVMGGEAGWHSFVP